MTVFTSRFGFKWNYAPHDTGWGTDYNFTHRELAALLHPIVISDTVTTPPGSPAENDTYFVPSVGATGAWSTHASKIAAFQGGAWQYYTPEVGTRMRIVSRSAFYWWNGTALVAEVTSGGGGGVLTVAGHSPDLAGNVALVVADITGAAPLSSPSLTGVPLAPTATPLARNFQIATTAYVDNAITAMGAVTTLTAGTGIALTGSGAYTISVTAGTYLLLAGGTMSGDLHLIAPAGSDNTDKAVSSAWVRTYVASLGLGTGSGSVTSVALTLPSWLSVSGSPVTTSGTLAVTATNQSANTLLAGPTTGSAAAPTFRSLVAADLPIQPYIISGFYPGVPANSQLLLVHQLAMAVTFPANFGTSSSGATSKAGCTINATASTVISIDKCLAANDPTSGGNWTQIGTLTISAGGHTAALATASGTLKAAAAGDFIRAVGPSTADATAANIFLTLAADR